MSLKMLVLMLQMFYRKGGYLIRDKFEEAFVEELKENIREKLPNCPECGEQLEMYSKRTNTDFGVIGCICYSDKCFSKYSKPILYKYIAESNEVIKDIQL